MSDIGVKPGEAREADHHELQLPEANYGAEVKAMQAVIAQMRNLIGNIEAVLFSLQVNSHRPLDRPKIESTVISMDKGDFIETQPTRLVRGFGCLSKEPVENVHTPAEESSSTASGS